jgi:hypothetical protein
MRVGLRSEEKRRNPQMGKSFMPRCSTKPAAPQRCELPEVDRYRCVADVAVTEIRTLEKER